MDFVCKYCGKSHGIMTIINSEIIHLNCLKEIETNETEIEEVILEE